jgi:uncharacterized protein with PIN domain
LVNVKLALKKLPKNMENTIQSKNSELHGSEASIVSETKSSEAVKLGRCPKCKRIIIRFAAEITHAVCRCSNPRVEVPLTVTITRERYEEGKRLAKELGMDFQELLKDVFELEVIK